MDQQAELEKARAQRDEAIKLLRVVNTKNAAKVARVKELEAENATLKAQHPGTGQQETITLREDVAFWLQRAQLAVTSIELATGKKLPGPGGKDKRSLDRLAKALGEVFVDKEKVRTYLQSATTDNVAAAPATPVAAAAAEEDETGGQPDLSQLAALGRVEKSGQRRRQPSKKGKGGRSTHTDDRERQAT